MTEVFLISDLHAEWYQSVTDLYKTEGMAALFVAAKDHPGATLVVAGDVSGCVVEKPDIMVEILTRFKKAFRYVLYVPGNHEYYNTQPMVVDDTLRCICDATNVVLLMRQVWQHPETKVLFVGCTLWSDVTPQALRQMSESLFIKLDQYRGMHRHDLQFLETQLCLRQDDEIKIVVVTHHLPTFQCIAPKYRNCKTLNTGFATSLEYLMGPNVKYWMCGHTHTRAVTTVGGTQVVNNPIGYPDEQDKPYEMGSCGPFAL
jgi:Icc-related predicted phosphoesterase